MESHMNQGRIISGSDQQEYLDTIALARLEKSFRDWSEISIRSDTRLSRKRILIIFLLIRYTGAKLNEVLALDPFTDIDFNRQTVEFGRHLNKSGVRLREVQISEKLAEGINNMLSDPNFRIALKEKFFVDPGFVRRKFYERARECGFPKQLGSPELIRKARAVEMMQNNVPLPVVQLILGHSTPNLTSSYVSFSPDEIRQVTRTFIEQESSRKTSARNSFFGKVQEIRQSDIQAYIRLATIGGQELTAIITNDSLERLGLNKGRLVKAEIKAPWIILQKGKKEPLSSAENRFSGTVTRINKGELYTEYAIRIADGTELCAVVSTMDTQRMNLTAGSAVWALFSCYAVVLHVE